jgi:hypothetical protein
MGYNPPQILSNREVSEPFFPLPVAPLAENPNFFCNNFNF